MKFALLLLLTIFIAACNSPVPKSAKLEQAEPNWQVSLITTQVNSYNKVGLLDTIYKTTDHRGSTYTLVTNSIITKAYDTRKNLLKEKDFEVTQNVTSLWGETNYQYDTADNLILKVDKFNNVIDEIVKCTYNNKKQKIQELKVLKRPDEHPAGWNVDSLIAHEKDKKQVNYDTSIITYQYDAYGNQTMKTYTRPDDNKSTSEIVLFSGNQKTKGFSLNKRGDTTSITTYQYQNSLLTEITQRKAIQSYTRKIYKNGKLVEFVSIDKKFGLNTKDVYKYDRRGNEIERVSYK